MSKWRITSDIKYFKFSLRDAWILKMQKNICQNSMGGLLTELSIIQTWHLVYFLKVILFVCFDIHNFKNEKETSPLCKHSKHHLNRTSFDVLRWLAINTSIIVIFYTCNCSVAKLDMRKNAEHKVWNCWE